jgi:adenylate kinase
MITRSQLIILLGSKEMRDMTLCVVVGLQCAGKTTFLLEAKKQGCVTLEWSEVIYDDLGCTIADDRTQWFKFIGQRVKEKGPTYYPNIIFQRLIAKKGAVHVLSGARNPTELAVLLGMYSHTEVIWIESDATKRFRRSKTRSRRDTQKDFIEFIRHDHEELRGGLAKILRQYVTCYIVNNASNEKFMRDIIALLERLKDRRNCNARI